MNNAQTDNQKKNYVIIMIVTFVLLYVSTYCVLRMTKTLVRVLFTYDKFHAHEWASHRIEYKNAVQYGKYIPEKRNWVIWIAFWPAHKTESLIRNIYDPMPEDSIYTL